MTKEQLDSLIAHYDLLYGSPPTEDNEVVILLCRIYQAVMKTDEFTNDTREGIAEQYRLLKSDGIPSYYWLLEAMHVTSKKHISKRNFGYIVGMVRNWKKHGFGYIPTSEESELVEYFEETTGVQLSFKARRLLKTFTASYGLIKTTRMISELNQNDISFVVTLLLGEMLRNRFGDRVIQDKNLQNVLGYDVQSRIVEHLNESNALDEVAITNLLQSPNQATVTDEITIADKTTSIGKVKNESDTTDSKSKVKTKNAQTTKVVKVSRKQKQNANQRKEKSQMKEEAELVEKIINNNGSPMRTSEIGRKLHEFGVDVTQKGMTSKLKSYMKYNKNIIKSEFGLYTIKEHEEESISS